MSARQAYKREPGKAVAEPGRSAELQMSTESTVPCAEGLRLKQHYESAVQIWREYTLPPQKQVVVAISTLQASRQEALAKRNTAADRMYLHRIHCTFCHRQR